MEERTLVFSLSEPLSYTKAGEKVETCELTLGAPCVKAFDATTRFSQSVTRAVLEMQGKMDPEQVKKAAEEAAKKASEEDDVSEEGLDASAVKVFLMASSEDLGLTFDAFKTLMSKVGMVDETTPLKLAHFDKMGYEDVLRMMCEYAADFIVPSLFAAESDG